MFDLEQSIAEWRQQMLAAGIQTPVPLEELESHLREGIERQTEAGLSEMEAFKAAVLKIGAAPAVQNEFTKVEATGADRDWKWVQIGLVATTGLFPLMIAFSFFSKNGFSIMTPGQQISGLAAAMVFSLLAWSGRLNYRRFPVIPTKRIRDVVYYASGAMLALWWIVLLKLVVPCYDFTMGQFLATFIWAFFTPAGAWIGLHWGMETAARKEILLAGS
jgi:hypothetical protein